MKERKKGKKGGRGVGKERGREEREIAEGKLSGLEKLLVMRKKDKSVTLLRV